MHQRTFRTLAALGILVVGAFAAAPAWAKAHDPDCGVVLRFAPPAPEGPSEAELSPFTPLGPATQNHPALPEPCQGQIRPGAPMTKPFGCTFSFIFSDNAGNLYVGTAGHCTTSVGQRVSTSQPVGEFGSVVYRKASGGSDFALVKIDDAKKGFVNPTMCGWGGPIGLDPGSKVQNDVYLEYGWGVVTQWHMGTRMRAHVETLSSADQIRWTGEGSGGDSGAPVVNQAGYAMGSHTFGLTPIAGVLLEGGPSIGRMLADGRTVVPSLELVLGDPTSFENDMKDLTY